MANITDTEVTKFTTSVVRPIADRLVGVQMALGAELPFYTAHLASLLAPYADDDVILDGGRNLGTKAELVTFLTNMNTLLGQLENASVLANLNAWRVNVWLPS